MEFIKKVINDSMDIWEKYLAHPFITGLRDGTLDEDKFVGYLVEDTIYLREYALVYAAAMYKSHSMEDIRTYYSVLAFVNDSEGSDRLRWLSERGLSSELIDTFEPKKANREYFGFMLDIAEKYDAPEILMAVLPCMFSYAYIFRVIEKDSVKGGKYSEFIAGYTSQHYYDECVTWARFAEEKCRGFDDERKARLSEIFRQSSEFELAFWDMAWEG